MSRLDKIDDWLNHEPCCDHSGADEHGCWDCLNTGHAHAQHISPEDARALVKFAKAVQALRNRVASAPFDALTRDSMERSLDAALNELEQDA